MSKWFTLRNFFAVYCIVVVGFIINGNPTLFSKQSYFKPIYQPVDFTKPTIRGLSEEQRPTASTAFDIFYRGHLSRSHQMPFQKDFKMNKFWNFPHFNIGIHTASKASPVVDSSGIYVGSDANWFFAFNHDGTVRWKFYASDFDKGIHSTAVLDDNFVFVGTYEGKIYCFNKESGALVWSRQVGHTIGSSPLSYENSLIVAVETYQPDGYVMRIDKRTGELIWLSPFLGEQSHSSPALDLKNSQILLGANNSYFFALNLKTGHFNWKAKVDGPVKGTPLIVNDHVYIADWGKSFWSLNLIDGTTEWKKKLDFGSQSSAAHLPKNGLLNILDKGGGFYLFNLKGGLVLKKKFDTTWMLSSSVAFVGTQERLLVTCRDRVLCLLDTQAKIISEFMMDGILTGVPFVYQNHIYAAVNEGSVWSIEMK